MAVKEEGVGRKRKAQQVSGAANSAGFRAVTNRLLAGLAV